MIKYNVGDIIEGTVIKIKPYGAIMIFDGNINGMLHISEIANTYIRNISRYLSIAKTYQVKVIGVEEDGFLKVSMAKISQEEKDAYHNKSMKRTPVDEDSIDFAAIKEALPNWIDEAKKGQ